MTVTHPHHPLFGQQVAVIRVRRGPDPDLIIRCPDGFHGAISASWTDYAKPAELDLLPDPLPLLDLAGLYQMVQLIDQIYNRLADANPDTCSDSQQRYAETERSSFLIKSGR